MIRRALVSVSDKTGLIPFVRALSERGVEILSTGGTLKALAAEGIPVTSVEEYTGSPEIMEGRVKTLHPRVHGGILMRGSVDENDLQRIGGKPIDLVVVNLYPFAKVASKPGASFEEIIENIDIGGPSMLRSAAKNHARVTVVCDPADYGRVLESIQTAGEVSLPLRKEFAAKVFAHTAAYDGLIAQVLSRESASDYPAYFSVHYEKAYGLRYGENPHQTGAFYREKTHREGMLAVSASLGVGGKELSFNNLVDVDAALECVREFETPSAVIVKHTNPCGVASASTLAEAFRQARQADSISAFGGIAAFNRQVDAETARAMNETFFECVVAPSYSEEALELLRTKSKLRILATGAWLGANYVDRVYKYVGGGIVLQDRDATAANEVRAGKVVSKRAPTPAEMQALEFAWRVSKHTKSNAIVLAQHNVTVGVGAGQMSRVESVRIAGRKAGDLAKGSVLASDAFFPFPDGVELAIEMGVTAIAEPGGSVKDPEVIAVADKANIAMVFTGVRHFRH